MRRRRIRIFIDGEVLALPHFSGIGHYTLELLRSVDKALEDYPRVTVHLGVYYKHTRKLHALGFKRIRIIPSPFSHRIANALKIRRKQPFLDLLYGKAVYVFPNFSSWPLFRSKSVPVIYDLSFEKYPEFAEPRNRAFLSEQVRLSVERATKIATISKNSRQEIASFYQYPEENISIYSPAVDTSRFRPCSEKEITPVKEKYGIKGRYILFVGNIEPRKNLKNLLLAYEKLPKELQSKYPLVLIGAKGWQDDEIRLYLDRLCGQGLKIIQPLKYVTDEDLPALYSGASLFIYPSLYEGFGIPPLEAMACGTPAITSDNSSLPEVVGEAAIMVNASSSKAIKNAMVRVLSDPSLQKKLSSAGIQQVSRFSWDASARKLLNDLMEL